MPRRRTALHVLGNAELALGRHVGAAQSYLQARELAIEIGTAQQHDATAGLARVALVQGDTAAAVRAIDPFLALEMQAGADGDALDDTDPPCLIELTCHQVLARAADPRAADWLRRAHERVQATAARISDPALRESFLQNLPHNREVIAAWAGWGHEGGLAIAMRHGS